MDFMRSRGGGLLPDREFSPRSTCEMFMATHLVGFGAAAAAGYRAGAVRFDATQYLSRGATFTGAADSDKLLMSFWFNMKGADGSTFRFMGNSGALGDGFNITRNTSNKLVIQVGTPGGAGNALLITSSTAFQTTSGWKHALFAYNDNSGSPLKYLYVSDASDTFSDSSSNGTADFTQTDTWFGAVSASAALNAEIADFYWAPGQYLDISSSANRRKFIDANGKPVSLGTDGSTPTGTKPIMFLTGGSSAFATNVGSGGGMTTTGSLSDAATSPSD